MLVLMPKFLETNRSILKKYLPKLADTDSAKKILTQLDKDKDVRSKLNSFDPIGIFRFKLRQGIEPIELENGVFSERIILDTYVQIIKEIIIKHTDTQKQLARPKEWWKYIAHLPFQIQLMLQAPSNDSYEFLDMSDL